MKKSQLNYTVSLVVWLIYILVKQQLTFQGLALSVRDTDEHCTEHCRGSASREKLPSWGPGLIGRSWIVRTSKLEEGTMERIRPVRREH